MLSLLLARLQQGEAGAFIIFAVGKVMKRMVIKPKVSELGEKLRLVCVPAEDFKTSQISVSLLVPRSINLAENIIIPKYLTYSSKDYPNPAALSAQLENLYGAFVNGSVIRRGESSKIELGATCINNKFALDNEDISYKTLGLVLKLLFEPCTDGEKFEKHKFELIKRLKIEDIESEVNDKRQYAFTRMIENMCRDEVFGITKEEILDDMRKSDEASAYKAWQELLKNATVQVNLIGAFDEEKSKELVEKYFSFVERKPLKNETVFVEQAEDVTEVTEEMDINQSKLVIGYRSGMKSKDDNFYAYQMMVDIFGGGPYSRLFMNVREKLSLCYYCSARLFKEKGIIVIQSGIESGNKQKALDEIAKQLEIMKKGEFEEKDFIASKTAICDSLRGVCDTPDGIDAFLNTKLDEPIIPLEEIIENYEKVTREDIIAAANAITLDTVYMLKGKEGGSDE